MGTAARTQRTRIARSLRARIVHALASEVGVRAALVVTGVARLPSRVEAAR